MISIHLIMGLFSTLCYVSGIGECSYVQTLLLRGFTFSFLIVFLIVISLWSLWKLTGHQLQALGLFLFGRIVVSLFYCFGQQGKKTRRHEVNCILHLEDKRGTIIFEALPYPVVQQGYGPSRGRKINRRV